MTFRDLWPWIRDQFPPARVVAFLSPFILTMSAALTTWIINHLPFIADQVNGDWVAATFLAILGSGIGLAYKWLDGRAKWEGAQVNAYVALTQANKIDAATTKSVLDFNDGQEEA